MIWLFLYFLGVTGSMVGFWARGTYFGDDVYDPDFAVPRFFGSFVWPILWVPIAGAELGKYLRGRQEIQRKLVASRELERRALDAKHKKYLKEAGLD